MPSASAQTTPVCRVSDFSNPDGSLDTVSYLGCIGQGSAPVPGPECPTGSLNIAAAASDPSLDPGDSTTVTLTGYQPNSTVTVTLCGNGVAIVLGTFTVGPDGTVTFTVTIPSNVPPGTYTLATSGNRSSGATQVAFAPITVSSSGGGSGSGGSGTGSGSGSGSTGTNTSGSLPRTGSDIGQLVGFALVLTVLGAAAAVGSRRLRPVLAKEPEAIA